MPGKLQRQGLKTLNIIICILSNAINTNYFTIFLQTTDVTLGFSK